LLDGADQVSEGDMRIHPEPFRPVENRRIFVVEDDEIIRSALQFILDDRNEAHAFRSLDLAFAKAANVRPDVVLLGIGFLQSDGKRRLAEIACRLSDAKILIVADSLRDPLALRSLDEGAHGVLGKPITFDSVHGKVNTVLDESSLSLVSLG
jgi:DNA-binding NarL/FixJ family response regulator